MSKFQKIVTELKKFLAEMPTEEKFEISPDDLVISEMKVGGKVEAKDATGAVIPCPDGEYTIGKDVIIVKDGFITSLNGETEAAPAEQMEEAPTEDKPKEDKPADSNKEIEDLNAKVDAMATEIEALKASIEEMKTGMSAESENTDKFSKQLEDLNNTIKTLIGIPAEFSKTNQSPIVTDARELKLAEMAKVGMILNKNKK